MRTGFTQRFRRPEHRLAWALTCAALAPVAMASCSSSKESEAPPLVTREPETGIAITTSKASIVPTRPRVPTIDFRAPADPTNLATLIGEGLGAYTVGPGRAMVDRTLDGSPAPTPGRNRKRVFRFVHTSDFQLADDELPSRLASADGPPPIEGAFRPQEGYWCRMMDAMVRTINGVHAAVPLDLVVLGGDNIDNAQANELAWALRILDGSDAFACDREISEQPRLRTRQRSEGRFFARGSRRAVVVGDGQPRRRSSGKFCRR